MAQHTVLIADDHSLMRDSLRRMIESLDGFAVIGEVDNGFDALVAVKKLQPALILLDVSMPDASGVEVVVDTQRWSPDTKIVVYTGVTAAAKLKHLFDSGIDGLFFKDGDSQELIAGMRVIAKGGKCFDKKLPAILADLQAVQELTEREKQVLSQILSGHTNRDIAQLLNISLKTVDNHRTRLMHKLDVHSISELMRLAVKTGLIDTDAP